MQYTKLLVATAAALTMLTSPVFAQGTPAGATGATTAAYGGLTITTVAVVAVAVAVTVAIANNNKNTNNSGTGTR